jgi:hypothetical protein
MPVLPLVDLLILLGTGSLAIGFILKAVNITMLYNPTVLGFSSIDFVVIAGVCLGLALTLVARTWMKMNEPHLLAMQSRQAADQARRRARQLEDASNGHLPPPPAPSEPQAGVQ